MGKEKPGFLTPKAIGNRIKSKGLQKLRWYCQMCEKQCRDENGFKCHCMSEAHQRQLLIAGENPAAFNNHFSNEFFKDFMQLLKTRFGTKRVQSNVIYNEYIGHKEHIHMNATKWVTLGGFTKWLGREGHCKVDQTEKGWFIQYIDRDPLVLKRQKELEKIKAREKGDDERHEQAINEMVKRGQDKQGTSEGQSSEFTELHRDGDGKIAFNIHAPVLAESAKPPPSLKNNLVSSSDAFKRKQPVSVHKPHKKKKSALDEIMAVEKAKKKSIDVRTENWLTEGIIVKVITKRMGDKYHKKKGVVTEVPDKFTAVVKMLDSGSKLKLDQLHVETVLPAIGKKVVIVNGKHRGSIAVMESVDLKKFCATVKIIEGDEHGKIVEDIKYEDISKKYDP